MRRVKQQIRAHAFYHMGLAQNKGSVQIAFAPFDVVVHDHRKLTLHLTMSFGKDAMSARDKPNCLVGIKDPNDKK